MDPRAIDLYNDYVHGAMPRRDFLARLAGIVGSAAAASALLPLLEPRYAQARQVADDDARLEIGRARYAGSRGEAFECDLTPQFFLARTDLFREIGGR